MKLTEEQKKQIGEDHGSCVNEACDACGRLLGAVRHTRKNEPGEWCSERCRDGVAQVEVRQARQGLRTRMRQACAMRSRTQKVVAVASTI